MREILVATNRQKILDFLIQYPGNEFLEKEIQKATKISKSGVNFALRDLSKTKLVKKQKRGKISFYSIRYDHPIVKQLKMLKTLVNLEPRIEKIKKLSKKIILYGSCSRGENTSESDIDLFIVTNNSNMINMAMKKNKLGEIIKLIIRSPLEYIEMEKTDPIFYKEIELGITVWESKDDSRI
ncbi:MAG: nucleotidyltransferase domain-containing protein [Candidatus Aminicenantes bacterium]|nr:nucleotidyltransferase domain-containing protein [Candidatus Aminicenantes bacterium]